MFHRIMAETDGMWDAEPLTCAVSAADVSYGA